jgi:hypothetical protein
MFAILDPPRPEVVAAIKEAHRAGITVKMITGGVGWGGVGWGGVGWSRLCGGARRTF